MAAQGRFLGRHVYWFLFHCGNGTNNDSYIHIDPTRDFFGPVTSCFGAINSLKFTIFDMNGGSRSIYRPECLSIPFL